jgi:thiamine kinase-like enzyme
VSLDRIAKLPCWSGEVRLERLHGGLSNESWKVTDEVGVHVVRFGSDFPFHHVRRDRELAAARAAEAAGFGPAVEFGAPGVMVTAYLGARTWTEDDMRANPARVGRLLREFHDRMPTLVAGEGAIFWVFHVIRDYARLLEEKNSRFAPELTRLRAIAAEMEAAQVSMPIVFGHHDLLPGNFLETADGRLWLIDFEYAAFGTGMFDLACAAGNAGLDESGTDDLLRAYFGAPPDAATLKAFDAMRCAALAREAMWAMVSEIFLAAPGADYDAHARDYLARLDAALDRFHASDRRLAS